jgi:thiol:disulfide interchange protein DsbC
MYNPGPLKYAASFLLALSLLASSAQAAENGPEADIAAKLQQARPDLKVESVRPSVAAGLYEVKLQGGPVLYATGDGDFFVLGDLFAVGIGGLTNLSEQQRDLERKEMLATVSREDMIIFSPEGETRGSVSVFTDVDCFYCQKLHQEVPALNKAGIEVRYLAYPRAGVGSDSYRKIASAWCSENRQQAITLLKSRQQIPENVCPGNPVADQFMLGQKAGVRGTPALVLDSGAMHPGYLSADDLTERMGLN